MGDGTGVLLHLDTKFYYALNATGLHVWKTLGQRSKTFSELTEAVFQTFEVDAERAGEDVERLLSDLAAEKLLLVVPA